MEALTEILAWATELIDSLTEIVTDSPLTYVIIFALAAIDVVFPLLPAEAIITTAAVLAGTGQLNIVWVMIAAGLGAFLGDNVAYWIGRAAGRPLFERVLRDRSGQLDTAADQFHQRGGAFIIVGRFVPGGRTVVAIGAGVLHFPWLKFILYDAVAAVIWAFQAALPGYIGGVLVADRPWLALLIGFGLSILVAAGMALFQRNRESKRRSDGPPDADGGDTASDDSAVDATGEIVPVEEDTP